MRSSGYVPQLTVRPLPLVVAVGLISLFAAHGWCGSTVWGQAGQAANVVVAGVERDEVVESTQFVATVRPLRRTVIGSAVDGRVIELTADEGDPVKAMEPLVILSDQTIKIELDVAEADLQLRQQELKELQNGFRPNEIEQTRARMQAAKADASLAEKQLKRLQRLREQSAVGQDDFDRALATAEQKNETYLDLKAGYELMVEGPRVERIAQAEAIVARQQAEVRKIEDRIEKYKIKSRFDGFIIRQMVEIGAWVQTGDPVMEVVQLDRVELQAFVPEQSVAFIERGRDVKVKIPALLGKAFDGKVKSVIPEGDDKARTFSVLIEVENLVTNGRPLIRSGFYAQISLPTTDAQNALLVPKDAIVLGADLPPEYAGWSSLYVVQDGADGPVCKLVPVRLGVASGGRIQVIGDIEEGQRVVVEGNERLRPGQPLKIREGERSRP